MLTLTAYLIADDVMADANLMRRQLEYSIKVRECSMTCDTANNPPHVVSTLHSGTSYKLYIVRSKNQIPMHGRYFHSFSDAYDWASGCLVDEARFHAFTENCVSPWGAAISELESKRYIVPEIKRVERNIKKGALYTTVIWTDGSKPTVVKCAEGDPPDIYFAVASAIAIKMYGSNSAYKRMIREKGE